MKKKSIYMLLFLAFLSFFASYRIYSPVNGKYRAEPVEFENRRGHTVKGLLYMPADRESGPFPAATGIHYGLQNREALQPMASTLAESGIIVLEMILERKNEKGKSRSFEDYTADTKGAVDYLHSHPVVRRQGIFLSGHSIGANLAATVGAADKKVAGVAAIGYPIEFHPSSRVNLLLTSGVFDELHQPSKIISAYRETLGENMDETILVKPVAINESIKEHEKNRILLFSFLSDHYLEPTDADITAGIIYFIKSLTTEAQVEKINPVPFRLKIILRILQFFSLFFIYIFVLCHLHSKNSPLKKLPRILLERAGLIFFTAAFIILSFFYRPGEDLAGIYLISPLLAASVVFNYFSAKRRDDLPEKAEDIFNVFEKDSKKVLIVIILLYLSYLAGTYFHAGTFCYSRISLFLRTIMGGFHMVFGHIFVFITRINGFILGNDWSINRFSLSLWIIIAIELIFPGGICRIFDEFFSSVIRALQSMDLKIKWKINPQEIILLCVVSVIGVFLWKQIISEGYEIGLKEILGLAYLFFCFIIIPTAVFTRLIRWNAVKTWLSQNSFPGRKSDE